MLKSIQRAHVTQKFLSRDSSLNKSCVEKAKTIQMNFIEPYFTGTGISIDKKTIETFRNRSRNVFANLPTSPRKCFVDPDVKKVSDDDASSDQNSFSEEDIPFKVKKLASLVGKVEKKYQPQNKSEQKNLTRHTVQKSRSSHTLILSQLHRRKIELKERLGYTLYSMEENNDTSEAKNTAVALDFLQNLKKRNRSTVNPGDKQAFFGRRRKKTNKTAAPNLGNGKSNRYHRPGHSSTVVLRYLENHEDGEEQENPTKITTNKAILTSEKKQYKFKKRKKKISKPRKTISRK